MFLPSNQHNIEYSIQSRTVSLAHTNIFVVIDFQRDAPAIKDEKTKQKTFSVYGATKARNNMYSFQLSVLRSKLCTENYSSIPICSGAECIIIILLVFNTTLLFPIGIQCHPTARKGYGMRSKTNDALVRDTKTK